MTFKMAESAFFDGVLANGTSSSGRLYDDDDDYTDRPPETGVLNGTGDYASVAPRDGGFGVQPPPSVVAVAEFRFPEYRYPDEFVVPMTVFMFVVMAFAFVGNSMTLLTIWRHRGMRTRTNMFVANLAVADVMVAVFDIPAAMVSLVKGTWVFGWVGCYVNGFTVGLGLMLSVHTLMWISVHKSMSITKPFSRTMTRRRVLIMIALAWAWTVFYNLSPFIIGWTRIEFKQGSTQCGPVPPTSPMQKLHSLINTVVNMLVPFVVMTVCYVRIFVAVRRHMKTMIERTNQHDFTKSLEQQKRIAVTLFIVLTCFLVCWMPYLVYSCTLAFGKHDLHPIYNPIAYWCGYFNSACNPIIYAWRSSSFRQGYLEIMCGRRVQGTIGGESWTADNLTPLKRFSVFFAPGRRASTFNVVHHQHRHRCQDYPSPTPSVFQRSLSFFSKRSSSIEQSNSVPGSPAAVYTKRSTKTGTPSVIQIRWRDKGRGGGHGGKNAKNGVGGDAQLGAEKKKISMIAEASCEDDGGGCCCCDEACQGQCRRGGPDSNNKVMLAIEDDGDVVVGASGSDSSCSSDENGPDGGDGSEDENKGCQDGGPLKHSSSFTKIGNGLKLNVGGRKKTKSCCSESSAANNAATTATAAVCIEGPEDDLSAGSGSDSGGIEVRILIHGAPDTVARSEQELQRLACHALRAVCSSRGNSRLAVDHGSDEDDADGRHVRRSSSSRRRRRGADNSNNDVHFHGRRRSLSNPEPHQHHREPTKETNNAAAAGSSSAFLAVIGGGDGGDDGDDGHGHAGASSLHRTQSERKLKREASSGRGLLHRQCQNNLLSTGSGSLLRSAPANSAASVLTAGSKNKLNIQEPATSSSSRKRTTSVSSSSSSTRRKNNKAASEATGKAAAAAAAVGAASGDPNPPPPRRPSAGRLGHQFDWQPSVDGISSGDFSNAALPR